MPDNKVHSGKTPGFLAKLRKIFGLNIGTVMFGAIFIYMIGSLTVEYKKKCLQALWCLLFLRQIFRFIL